MACHFCQSSHNPQTQGRGQRPPPSRGAGEQGHTAEGHGGCATLGKYMSAQHLMLSSSQGSAGNAFFHLPRTYTPGLETSSSMKTSVISLNKKEFFFSLNSHCIFLKNPSYDTHFQSHVIIILCTWAVISAYSLHNNLPVV